MSLADDLRRAFQRLRGRPGTALFAAAMLGLGIGLTTVMSTVIDALFVRRAPFANVEQLGRMTSRQSRMPGMGGQRAYRAPVVRAWRTNPGFVAVEGASVRAGIVASAHASARQSVGMVSPGLFPMLGVAPVHGRAFQHGEGRAGTDDRVVMTERFWEMLGGGARFTPGAPITIDGREMHVVGLMPSTLRFPTWDVQIWRAVDVAVPPPDVARRSWDVIVRFADDIPREATLARAGREAQGADSLPEHVFSAGWVWPSDNIMCRFDTTNNDAMTCSDRDAFFTSAVPVLTGATLLVFLVLCANVASLLLTQYTARRREYGVCTALGAPRFRLLREVMVEGALLSGAGVAIGVAIAWAGTGLVAAFLPDVLVQTSLNTIELDARALAVSAAGGVAAAGLAGILPAWVGTRVDPAVAMRGAGRGATANRASRLTMHGLLAVEVALVCTILVGATMLVRSFVAVTTIDRGLDVRGVTMVPFGLDEKTYTDSIARRAAALTVESAARQIPGVIQTLVSYGAPPDQSRFGGDWKSDVPGVDPSGLVDSYDASPAFFDFYRIPLRRGRIFGPGDGPRDVVVGERMARVFWPGLDPVGRSFAGGDTWYRVVGVVGELEFPTLNPSDDRPEFYRPLRYHASSFVVSLRCTAKCPSSAVIQHHLRPVTPGLNARNIRETESDYAKAYGRPRGLAQLAMLFGGTSVLAAALGLFGVIAFGVAQRTRELTIRGALGATAAQIRALVIGDGAKIAAVGLVVGSVGAWFLSRALSGMLYRVTRNDPETWLAVVAVIGFTTVAACWGPARRAARVDIAALARDS
jgi:putative ABC transport system permease protein